MNVSSNKQKKIQGFDLSFIWKPSGRGTSWQDIRTLKFKIFHRRPICSFLIIQGKKAIL